VLVEWLPLDVEVHQYHWAPGYFRFVTRYSVAVRYPARPDSPVFTEAGQAIEDRPSTLFRVLEWFRDPTGHDLFYAPDGWLPPDHWDAARFQAGPWVESSWGGARSLEEMLVAAGPSLTERKLRLAACVIARHLPVAMLEERNRLAVARAEEYAEGAITKREMKKATRVSDLRWLAESGCDLVRSAAAHFRREDAARADEVTADALREVLCDPYRLVTVRHAWLRAQGGLARRLAESAAAEQDYGVLPVLADALEDAGCADAAILSHLRGPGTHVRGCWVLDLLLGKQ
jgi:hypothetical protein